MLWRALADLGRPTFWKQAGNLLQEYLEACFTHNYYNLACSISSAFVSNHSYFLILKIRFLGFIKLDSCGKKYNAAQISSDLVENLMWLIILSSHLITVLATITFLPVLPESFFSFSKAEFFHVVIIFSAPAAFSSCNYFPFHHPCLPKITLQHNSYFRTCAVICNL